MREHKSDDEAGAAGSTVSAVSAGSAGLAPGGQASTVGLRDVLEMLEGSDLTVWAGPPGHEPQLRHVVVHDVAGAWEAGPGDLLLAVGVDTAADAAPQLLAEAGRRGVTGVVIRHAARMEHLASTARQVGVALLALEPGLSWAEATSRFRGALATAGTGPETPGLPGRDLLTFVNALSSSLGGSVTVFSPQQVVLASSRIAEGDDALRQQAVLDQHGPAWYREILRSRGIYRKLWEGEEVVDVAGIPERDVGRRLAVGVRAGGEVLASIWAAEGGHPLSVDAAETLRNAVQPVAAHVLRLRAQAEQRSRFEEGLGRRLLTGEGDPFVAARWLALDPESPCAVIACQLPGRAESRDTGARSSRQSDVHASREPRDPRELREPRDQGLERRLTDLLSLHVSAYRWTTVLVPSRGGVDVIVSDLADHSSSRVARLARAALTGVAASLEQPLLGGVGRTVSSLERLSESRAEADLVLRVLRSSPDTPTRVATLDSVQSSANVLLLTDIMDGHPQLLRGPVRTLLDHDRRHHTGYAASLAAYLESFGDVPRAARQLRVHPNTLRYRLRRLVEISGIELDDPDERLMATLQLRARR